jgi:hypothetical protein
MSFLSKVYLFRIFGLNLFEERRRRKKRNKKKILGEKKKKRKEKKIIAWSKLAKGETGK